MTPKRTASRLQKDKLSLTAVRRISKGLLLESLGDGVIATDANGAIFYLNPFAEAFLGMSFAQVKGSDVCLKMGVEDESGKNIPVEKRPAQIAFRTGRRVASRISYYVRADGSRCPVACAAAPIVLDKKRVGAVTVFRDITEEQRIERAENEFIGLASHQIQAPLSIIKWYAERLLSQSDGRLNERQQALGNEVYMANQRMIDTVNAMLGLSRIEMGQYNVELANVKIAQELELMLSGLKPLIDRKHLDVKVVVKGLSGVVSIDPRVFHIAAENFLVNAIQYTPAAGHILIVADRKGKRLQLRIQDSGIGIPKDQKEQIFTKFFRAKNARVIAPNGNGLGLYIVKMFVEAAKGKVWFESEEGEGSTFFVEIPIK